MKFTANFFAMCVLQSNIRNRFRSAGYDANCSVVMISSNNLHDTADIAVKVTKSLILKKAKFLEYNKGVALDSESHTLNSNGILPVL